MRLSAAYVFGIAVYMTVIIPALRTIVTPIVDVDSREDRIEAMRVLSAGNIIIMFFLVGILVLQVNFHGVYFSSWVPMLIQPRLVRNMSDGQRPPCSRSSKRKRGERPHQYQRKKSPNDTYSRPTPN